MEEASHCNQLAFIYRGRLIAQGTPQQIRERAAHQRILEVAVADPDAALEVIAEVPDVLDAYLSGATVHAVLQATGDEPSDAESLLAALRSQGLAALSVVPVEPTIDDVFVRLVSSQRVIPNQQGARERRGRRPKPRRKAGKSGPRLKGS
jgi:drug efflux transport system ATP-binding protein